MKYASLCSGVESTTLAWKSLGWEPLFFSEIDKFPNAVLNYHYPNIPNLGDMTKIDGDKYKGKLDLIVGGTPCQGFSCAGKKKGLHDEYSSLAKCFIKLLSQIQPRWFIWENVVGALSTNGGSDFKKIIAEFTDAGYCVAWRVLDAQWVRTHEFPNAIPQRRRRLFVVGHLGTNPRYPSEVLFEPNLLRGDTPPCRKTTKCPTTTLGIHLQEGCTREDTINTELDNELIVIDGHERDSCKNLSPTLIKRIGTGGNNLPLIVKSEINAVAITENIIGRLPETDGKGVGAQEEVAYTHLKNGVQGVATNYIARKLTPKECERLMGFPDDYTNIPWRDGFAPDNLRYQACGNSMCVNVMQWIGERIQRVENMVEFK